jgi:hypothetical protein
MKTKKWVTAVALAIGSSLVVGCGGSDSGQTGDDQNVTAGAFVGCTAEQATACTPDVGSDLRKGISDLLRYSIMEDLKRNGVPPNPNDVKFVFKTLRIQTSHIYAAATIMRADGTTNYDFSGTPSEGKRTPFSRSWKSRADPSSLTRSALGSTRRSSHAHSSTTASARRRPERTPGRTWKRTVTRTLSTRTAT